MSYILINPIACLEKAMWTAEIGSPAKLLPHAQQKSHCWHQPQGKGYVQTFRYSAGKKALELNWLFIIFYFYEQSYMYVHIHICAFTYTYTQIISCNYISIIIHKDGICISLSSSYFMLTALLSLPKAHLYQKIKFVACI